MLPERKPICMIFLVAVDEYDTQVMCPSIKVYKCDVFYTYVGDLPRPYEEPSERISGYIWPAEGRI